MASHCPQTFLVSVVHKGFFVVAILDIRMKKDIRLIGIKAKPYYSLNLNLLNPRDLSLDTSVLCGPGESFELVRLV